MLSIGISCILLLIHIISTVRGGLQTICKGQCTQLSCPGTNSEDNANENILWKKQTGETVIWRDFGVNKGGLGDTYKDGKVNIFKNLTLVIKECDQSDQGVYILRINGQLSCQVRLLVNDKCKRSSENLCENLQLTTDATEEREDTFETSSHRHRFGVILLLSAAVLISGGVFAYKRKKTRENYASKFKEMPLDCTVVQSNTA